MKTLLIFLILSSCATSPYKEVKNDITQGNASISGVLSVANTSYIKGCIEGMNELSEQKSRGRRFDICKKLSSKHIEGMRELLEAP